MQGSSDDILDRIRTREVTASSIRGKLLAATVQGLLVAGVDHADIDVSASLDELQRRTAVELPVNSPPHLADVPTAARQPIMGEDDVLNTEAVVGSIADCIGAVALAFYLVAQDMTPLSVGMFSVLTALVVGGAAMFLSRRRLQRKGTLGLEKPAKAHGLLIGWEFDPRIRIRSAGDSDAARRRSHSPARNRTGQTARGSSAPLVTTGPLVR